MTWYAIAAYQAAAHDVRTALVAGAPDDEQLYDLATVFRAVSPDADPPKWMSHGVAGTLAAWPAAELLLGELARAVTQDFLPGVASLDRRSASVVAPLQAPRIFAAASNYVEHADEMGTVLAAKADSKPYIFIKASTAVVGPGETVRIPPETQQADWEVELAAVIGKPARRVGVAEALDHVAGYTVINDVSARDLTRRSDYPFKFDWFQGKSLDTFAPLGPWIVPARLLGDPQTLPLRLAVNDRIMQDGTTAEMIFSVAEQISYLSSLLTLQPGDVIATGTPTGVGKSRGIFLQPGDVMRAHIDGIGTLENPVEAELVKS